MASTSPNVIVIRSNNTDNMRQRLREQACTVAVTPGMLLEMASATQVRPHTTADGEAQGRKVAIENWWSDHGDGKAIDHPYAIGETVFYLFANPGDRLYMWLEAGASVAAGAPLTSNGAGSLQAVTVAATVVLGAIVGYAAETVDNGAGGSPVRIQVDIA